MANIGRGSEDEQSGHLFEDESSTAMLPMDPESHGREPYTRNSQRVLEREDQDDSRRGCKLSIGVVLIFSLGYMAVGMTLGIGGLASGGEGGWKQAEGLTVYATETSDVRYGDKKLGKLFEELVARTGELDVRLRHLEETSRGDGEGGILNTPMAIDAAMDSGSMEGETATRVTGYKSTSPGYGEVSAQQVQEASEKDADSRIAASKLGDGASGITDIEESRVGNAMATTQGGGGVVRDSDGRSENGEQGDRSKCYATGYFGREVPRDVQAAALVSLFSLRAAGKSQARFLFLHRSGARFHPTNVMAHEGTDGRDRNVAEDAVMEAAGAAAPAEKEEKMFEMVPVELWDATSREDDEQIGFHRYQLFQHEYRAGCKSIAWIDLGALFRADVDNTLFPHDDVDGTPSHPPEYKPTSSNLRYDPSPNQHRCGFRNNPQLGVMVSTMRVPPPSLTSRGQDVDATAPSSGGVDGFAMFARDRILDSQKLHGPGPRKNWRDIYSTYFNSHGGWQRLPYDVGVFPLSARCSEEPWGSPQNWKLINFAHLAPKPQDLLRPGDYDPTKARQQLPNAICPQAGGCGADVSILYDEWFQVYTKVVVAAPALLAGLVGGGGGSGVDAGGEGGSIEGMGCFVTGVFSPPFGRKLWKVATLARSLQDHGKSSRPLVVLVPNGEPKGLFSWLEKLENVRIIEIKLWHNLATLPHSLSHDGVEPRRNVYAASGGAANSATAGGGVRGSYFKLQAFEPGVVPSSLCRNKLAWVDHDSVVLGVGSAESGQVETIDAVFSLPHFSASLAEPSTSNTESPEKRDLVEPPAQVFDDSFFVFSPDGDFAKVARDSAAEAMSSADSKKATLEQPDALSSSPDTPTMAGAISAATILTGHFFDTVNILPSKYLAAKSCAADTNRQGEGRFIVEISSSLDGRGEENNWLSPRIYSFPPSSVSPVDFLWEAGLSFALAQAKAAAADPSSGQGRDNCYRGQAYKAWFGAAQTLDVAGSAFPAGRPWGNCSSRVNGEAYVTLISRKEWIPAVEILAKSLRLSKTKRPFVVVVPHGGPSVDVDEQGLALIEAAGAQICHVPHISNPSKMGQGAARRDCYNKLWPYALPLRTVVFLDADTLVASNVDELFSALEGGLDLGKGGSFWGKHVVAGVPEGKGGLYNSGVYVVHPSTAVFEDMLDKVPVLPTSDAGDQGFFDSYYFGGKGDREAKGLLVLNGTYNFRRSMRMLVHEWVKTWFPKMTHRELEDCFQRSNDVKLQPDQQCNQMFDDAIRKRRREIKIIHFVSDLKPWMWTATDVAAPNPKYGKSKFFVIPALDEVWRTVRDFEETPVV